MNHQGFAEKGKRVIPILKLYVPTIRNDPVRSSDYTELSPGVVAGIDFD